MAAGGPKLRVVRTGRNPRIRYNLKTARPILDFDISLDRYLKDLSNDGSFVPLLGEVRPPKPIFVLKLANFD